jgi:hypothetical protein
MPPGQPLKLPADSDDSGIKINVLPAQPKSFSLPQAQRVNGQVEVAAGGQLEVPAPRG